MASTGKTYQNHTAAIRRWAVEDRRGEAFTNDNGNCSQEYGLETPALTPAADD